MKITLALIIALAALAIAPAFASAYVISLFIAILMYVTLAQSWTIFSGYTGYISLATAAFFGMGSYTTAIMTSKIPLAVVTGLAALISFVVALPIGFVSLRLRGPYFTILTFGLSELIAQFFLWWELRITGTRGRMIMPLEREMVYYFLLFIAVAVFLTAYFIRRSKLGLALKSIGQDEEKAETLGVNTTLYKVALFSLSAAFMGAVGSALTPRWTYLDPYIAFNPLISFQTVIMALVGGVGNLYGPILGASVLALLSEMFLTMFPYHYMIMLGIVLIIIVLFFPEGLTGLIVKRSQRQFGPGGGEKVR